MCVVSNIGDYGKSIWARPLYPDIKPSVWPAEAKPPMTFVAPYAGPTKEQFEEFLELLRAARKFDKATGQADCPSAEKIDWMQEAARQAGVDPGKVKAILEG